MFNILKKIFAIIFIAMFLLGIVFCLYIGAIAMSNGIWFDVFAMLFVVIIFIAFVLSIYLGTFKKHLKSI